MASTNVELYSGVGYKITVSLKIRNIAYMHFWLFVKNTIIFSPPRLKDRALPPNAAIGEL
jgi:hypothetical protein